jgi:hypothetical protein
MFSRTRVLRGLTTNAVGPKTMRQLDPKNDRYTRWNGLRRMANKDPELFVSLSPQSVGIYSVLRDH